jgi:hypothetical protein
MSTIYLDRSAVTSSDADERLAHLVESGHELILVTGGSRPGGAAPGGSGRDSIPWAGRTTVMPGSVARGSWFVTADPSTCGGHQAGLRTLLIGPKAETPRPTRCDATVRDLRDAVLEILTSDAMG